jgi:hypothetical protein
MRKAIALFAVLALAAPAMAVQLDINDATPWQGGWGGPATLIDNGDGSFDAQQTNGSAGAFWRIEAFASEIVTLSGSWEGSMDGAAWAEILLFTSTEGWTDGDVGSFINGTATGDPEIVAKYEASFPAEEFSYDIHATCAEVIVAVKVGQATGGMTDVTYSLDVVPEPATALLLGLPLVLVRRRR